MCEKCEYYKYLTFGQVATDNACVKCKEMFPWLDKSQFKEKVVVK